MYNWIYEEKHPSKKRKSINKYGNTPNFPRNPSINVKLKALHRCFELGENIMTVSEDIGYSRTSIYLWRKKYLKEGTVGLMNNKNIKSGKLPEIKPKEEKNSSSSEDIFAVKSKIEEMQMEIDILKETINVLKKDPGIDQSSFTNKEKTVIIDALKNNYSLSSLLNKLNLPKSSYYYQKSVQSKEDMVIEESMLY